MEIRKFALQDHRKKNYDKEVWVPLRVASHSDEGTFGSEGYSTNVFALTSVAVPLGKVETASGELNWHSMGPIREHVGYVQGSVYHPADLFEDCGFTGLNLVICQRSSNGEPHVWHIHPDLITTLNLRREGNSWVASEEGYIEVIRYVEKADLSPERLEIRAEFLKDYLCARGMALRISLYAEIEVNVKQVSDTDWTALDAEEISDNASVDNADRPRERHWRRKLADGRWEGSLIPIHKGGHAFGSGFAVFFAGRKNFDYEQSVPEISPSDEMDGSTRTGQFTGSLLYRVIGEMWRDQWVNPASSSVRVRGDKVPSTCFFIVDAEGRRRSDDELRDSGRCLWFSPGIITKSLLYRGASLSWYTRDTGCVAMACDGGVTFGVNELGLVNVYAKDIALMPIWQKRIWSGFNVSPDGGVSRELLLSQAEGMPARTLAPEAFLTRGRDELNEAIFTKFGRRLFRAHTGLNAILPSCHRFRADDKAGLLELAKDLARITADDIDSKQLQEIIPLEGGEKRGSLKCLERVIARVTSDKFAAAGMKVLFAIYELRLAAAHLPSGEVDGAFIKLGLNTDLPYVLQGRDLLIALVDTLHGLARTIRLAGSMNSQQESAAVGKRR